MIRLAANLSTMFTEHPFTDRFAAAADAGFEAVEFLFPYDLPADRAAAIADKSGLAIALFNLPAGDWGAGERGLGVLTGRESEFRESVSVGLRYARMLNCRSLHLMAGRPVGDPEVARGTLVENIRFAADHAADAGVTLLLEPINTRIDMPGYFYDSSATAMAIIAAVARPNVRLQYDVYHMAVMGEDPASTMEALLPAIGHIQIADFPGRHEPGTGTLDVLALLQRIDALGYHGYVGCEYRPATTTSAGLGWARSLLYQPRPRPPFPSDPEVTL